MRILALFFILTGCIQSDSGQLFIDTKENGCMEVSDVTYGDLNLGNFVLCTAPEYKKRISK
jgi:hypothetical protein